MAMETRLSLRQSQRVVMTPLLQQAKDAGIHVATSETTASSNGTAVIAVKSATPRILMAARSRSKMPNAEEAHRRAEPAE